MRVFSFFSLMIINNNIILCLMTDVSEWEVLVLKILTVLCFVSLRGFCTWGMIADSWDLLLIMRFQFIWVSMIITLQHYMAWFRH